MQLINVIICYEYLDAFRYLYIYLHFYEKTEEPDVGIAILLYEIMVRFVWNTVVFFLLAHLAHIHISDLVILLNVTGMFDMGIAVPHHSLCDCFLGVRYSVVEYHFS